MERNEFLKLFDEIVEGESGMIKEDHHLADIEGWDSMAVMGLIAIVDEKFGITLVPDKIVNSNTVADIIALLDGQIT